MTRTLAQHPGKKMSHASLFESLEKRELLSASLPAAPTNLKCVGRSTTALTLQWVDHAGNETGFNIYRSADGTVFKKINSIGANITTYINGKLKTGAHYWYRVRAFNSAGESKATKTAEGVPLTPVNIAAPTGLAANPTSATAVKLTWLDHANNETGYVVERSLGSKGYRTVNTVGPNVTSYINGKLL